ncbi:MAG: hypothetical protein ACK462_17595, partial [Planctomyces sp.]
MTGVNLIAIAAAGRLGEQCATTPAALLFASQEAPPTPPGGAPPRSGHLASLLAVIVAGTIVAIIGISVLRVIRRSITDTPRSRRVRSGVLVDPWTESGRRTAVPDRDGGERGDNRDGRFGDTDRLDGRNSIGHDGGDG